ncbi:tyrosine-protein phosphatase [Comamonas serinivorans]|uniref:tyrosine-protein phosphatase n=1 Tax=Comamonas serinivorans TaxID=1082851 RepID=UPI001F4790A6|nr:tyrosine-protein phosphatase [Comamonas serinivorans]
MSTTHTLNPAAAQSQPTRSLGLLGATNFRDLGGYLGADGRRVVWRRLFRSDNLARLTPQDYEAIQGLRVQRSFDFRGQHERAASPYELLGLTQHSLPIEPTVVQGLQELVAAGEQVTPVIAVSLMQDTYRGFVNHNAERFAALFQALLSSDDPLVFHCTAGKDRTGFAAALILHVLGVSQDDIMADYLLTNALYQRPDTPHATNTPIEVLRVIWQVQPDFLTAAFEAVDAGWGNTDTYLRDALGVGADAQRELRARYLA